MRPDIADWSVQTELLAVIAEALTGQKVRRPAHDSEPAPAPTQIATTEEMQAFFRGGGTVHYVPAEGG